MSHTARALALSTCLAVGLSAPSAASAQALADSLARSTSQAAAAGDASSDSITAIVKDTIEDFSRLPSWATVAVLSVGAVGSAAGHAIDARVTRSFSGSAALGRVLGPGEVVGGARMQLAGAIATYAAGRVSGSRAVSDVGADLIRANLVAQSLTAAVKVSVGRTRPDGTQYSFPSGHTSVSFATATVLQRNLGWKAGIPAYGMAAYVAASRVQVKRHYLSDVAFGAALGIVAGRTVTVGRGDTTFALVPAASTQGASINFTLVGKH